MSEERRDQTQEEARRVLSPVRLAVLLLLGALFLVVGGSRADAAGAEPAQGPGPKLVSGTLAALDAGPDLAAVGATVDGVVDPVLTATEPVVAPVVEPVVRPVVAPVVTPLRPALERMAAPLAGLPVAELVAPVVPPTSAARVASAAHHGAVERLTDTPAAPDAATVDRPETTASAASAATPGDRSDAPVHGAPVSRTSASSSDGGTGSTPVPYAVLLTAFAAVLLFAGGIAPGRVAPPLAPTFLPPVFPG